MRHQLKSLVRRAGLEEPARAALDAARPERRRIRMLADRDRSDNETLQRLLAFTLRPDSDCVDIGCNRGLVLTEMTRLAPAGRHVAFEPVPELASELRRRFPDVAVHQMALSDASGTATFTHVVDDDALSGLHDRGLDADHELRRFEVPVARLDDVLPADLRPAFVKIDVEGAEMGVLRGAVQTLLAHRPTIWFEHGVEGAPHFGTSSADLWDLLCGELEYRLFDSLGRGPYSRQEFGGPAEPPVWNFVAR